MISRKILAAALAVSLWAGAAATVRADDAAIAETGRKVLASCDKAVISVTVTIKLSMQGDMAGARLNEQEKKNEIAATLLDPSGLAICSLTALDPTSAMGNLKVNVGGEQKSFRIKADISEAKYRLPDGTEVPARVVLKDEDLDLAFLAPEKPLDAADRAKILTLNLADSAKDLQLLEPVIFVSRLGKQVGYESAVSLGRVSARLTRPRTEYIAGGAPGQPAFTKDGKLLGIVLTHRRGEQDIDVMGGMAALQREMTAVIIPAADIVEAANQAKEEAKKPPKKKEAAADKAPEKAPETAPEKKE
ncbi:MAG: serine protease [Tepidisphaeraceae bacterium]